MVRVYDRALLRSSGRIHGDPVELILDRCAIDARGPGCEHPGYAISCDYNQLNVLPMHITNRPLTHEERGFLNARLDAMLRLQRRRRWILFAVVFGLALTIFLSVFAITRQASSGFIMAAIGTYFSFMIWGQRMRSAAEIAREKGEISNLKSDLEAGLVSVSEIDVHRSLQVDSSSLGTYEFYLDVGDAQVMFLAGDYLSSFIATKQFPPRSISLSICEHTGIRWELNFMGGLTDVRMRIARTPALGRETFKLVEGSIKTVEFDLLAKDSYAETVA